MFNKLFTKFNHYLYVARCHLWSKYNRITVKSLPPTWNDRDTLLAHTCFQILTDFVDKERPETLKETYRSVLERYTEPEYSSDGWYDDGMKFAKKRTLGWAIIRKCYYFHKYREVIEEKAWLTYLRDKGNKKCSVQTYRRSAEKIDLLEDKFLRQLVENRDLLWT